MFDCGSLRHILQGTSHARSTACEYASEPNDLPNLASSLNSLPRRTSLRKDFVRGLGALIKVVPENRPVNGTFSEKLTRRPFPFGHQTEAEFGGWRRQKPGMQIIDFRSCWAKSAENPVTPYSWQTYQIQ